MASGRSSRAQSSSNHPGNELLAELFSSRVRSAVLGFMVAREEARFSLTELSRITGMSISSIQHECYKLERLGVLAGRREGASRRYWLERNTPFVPVLMWLVASVVGHDRLLEYALMDIDGLSGAVASRTGAPQLVLIGDVAFEDVAVAQERVAKILEVEPGDVRMALYSASAWNDHVTSGSDAVAGLRAAEASVIVGDPAVMLPPA